jgi:hypothetical protein
VILPISASWIARIAGMSHCHLLIQRKLWHWTMQNVLSQIPHTDLWIICANHSTGRLQWHWQLGPWQRLIANVCPYPWDPSTQQTKILILGFVDNNNSNICISATME